MLARSLCLFVILPGWVALATVPLLADDSRDLDETALLGLLQSDAPAAEKAIACKKLAICGTASSVGELSKLLPDPQLSSWARIALEVIPDSEAGAALREAGTQLKGRLLIGVVHSIGVRKDVQAVPLLVEHLQGQDEDVAAAAAYSLGHIGNAEAVNVLRNNLDTASPMVRSAVAEGCILCAERKRAAGDLEIAEEIYDEVRKSDVPLQRIVEATRGTILAQQSAGIPLLLETLKSPQKEMQQIALSTIREFPGRQLDQVLAKEMVGLSPRSAALLIQAMSDRPGTVDLSAIVEAAGEGDKTVRLSALDALGRIGNASCLTVLLTSAGDDDGDLSNAAMQTLAILPGKDVDDQIVARLSDSKATEYRRLLELVGKRRIAAMDQVVIALNNNNADIRKAALYALGETVTLDKLPVLIDQVVEAKNPNDVQAAEQALAVACVRMPNPDQCASQLGAAMKRASQPTQNQLLEIVASVGGEQALRLLANAAKSANADHQDIGSRLLGKWNGVEAAPVLLDLASTAPADKYKVRALRGYIGIARKFPMSVGERVKMCQSAMDAAMRVNEKELVLQVLKLHPSRPGLNLVNEAKKIPELAQEANTVAAAIEQKIGKK